MVDLNKRFLVALSFPGEYREFVETVAHLLSQELGKQRVLYDKFHEAEFARPNLDTHLQSLYHDESELLVVFLCADYERKEWTGLEWRAIRDLIKKKQDTSIMLIRLDDANISGLFSIDGYISANGRKPTEIAALITSRLRQAPHIDKPSGKALQPLFAEHHELVSGRSKNMSLHDKEEEQSYPDDEWWENLERTVVDLYSQGLIQHEIWSRAGGDLSVVNLNASSRGAWHAALRSLKQGGGGQGISHLTLLSKMLEDYPDNRELKALRHSLD
jgi:hypothetical protein